MDYSINYREYDSENNLLEDYFKTACFNKIFSRGVESNTEKLIMYIPPKHLNIPIDKYKIWLEDISYVGLPCKYEGLSTEKGLEWLNLKEPYHIVSVPAKEYKSNVHIRLGLTYVRYGYDMSGHCGKDPHTIITNYFQIKENIPGIDLFHAMIIAGAMYGEGAHHIAHNKSNLILFSMEDFFEATPKGDNRPTKGAGDGCALHNLFNKFAKFNYDKKPQTYKEYYEKVEEFSDKKKKTKVYVVGKEYETYTNWLPNVEIVHDLDKCDLVLFGGGEDVSPSYYKDKKHPQTINNPTRDRGEKFIFEKALAANKKMLGVCRGSQFLCVMSGGKLVQHQENREYIHPIMTRDRGVIYITSTHHQAAYPFKMKKWDYKILGWTENKSRFHLNGNKEEMYPEKECEIVYYPKTNALGIQGHPEHIDYQKNYKGSLDVLVEIFNNFMENKIK